ncbi:MAG: sulfite exporter TauE/SafE family protein [Candidatus Sumerlaeota bacterium]|nr:sulfite exporter TauE/SafE family protein [Candidatus Sumerlaeota bacterium]
MPGSLSGLFVNLTWMSGLEMALLGLIGGVLSGFIGSGGAFFMTPGMMNLGVPGAVAVASNVAHKFGKAMVGQRKHRAMGNVDRRLGLALVLTGFLGVRLAVYIQDLIFSGPDSTPAQSRAAASDLYISVVFILVLGLLGIGILGDALRSSRDGGPSHKIVDAFSRLRTPPLLYFPVADVRVSLWLLLIIGMSIGYMVGTIGVGGFIGVPAMIYVFGVPTAVATGTELYLAMFNGAFATVLYGYEGFVDIRLTLLLFLGSLVGIHIGAYGTMVVRESLIRLVTAVVILLCVVSRAIAVPAYLRQLGWIAMGPEWDGPLNAASRLMLFVGGFSGVGLIMANVFKAYAVRRRVRAMLQETREGV